MWFDDEGGNRKRSRNASRPRRGPVFEVNARLRDRRSGWFPKAVSVALLIVAAGAAVAIGRIGVFEAERALFSGNENYAVRALDVSCEGGDDLKEFVAGRLQWTLGTNIFLVDIGEVQADIARIPRVRSARVARLLPGEMRVSVTERIPVARLGHQRDDARGLVIDGDGSVFASTSRSKIGVLPVITGYRDGRPTVGERLGGEIENALLLLEVCCSSQAGQGMRIEAVNVGGKDMRAKLADGPLVTLPANGDIENAEAWKKDIENRLKALRGVLWKAEQAGVSLRTADLSGDNYADYIATTPRWDGKD